MNQLPPHNQNQNFSEGEYDGLHYSIIVVAFNNEPHIVSALKSCLFDHDSFEVIVIFNKSSDLTLASIQSVRHLFKNFTLIANTSNIGLGPARNQGLAIARGEYVLFLDGDDYFSDKKALSYLDGFREHNPDITIFDHEKVEWGGEPIKNPNKPLLSENKVCNDPQSKKKLFPNFGVAWNKCYKTAFLRQHDLSFPQGLYEDIPWNFQALMKAETVCACEQPLITYRIRTRSILRSQSRDHLQCIHQYRRLLNNCRNINDSATYLDAIYYYAAGQIASVYLSGRLPRRAKREFRNLALNLLNELRHEATNVSYDACHAVMRFAPLGTTTQFLKRAPQLWSLKRRLESCSISALFTKIKISIYRRILTKLPLNKHLVHYESYWGTQLSCNPYYIFKEALKHESLIHHWNYDKRKVHGETLFSTLSINNKLVRVSKPLSLASLWHMARARILITNTNFPDFFKKRPGSIVINTQHGTPLKAMGFHIRRCKPRAMNWKRFAERSQNWDYVLSSNMFSSDVWREAMPFNYRVLNTGYPRNDILVNELGANRERVRRALGLAPDEQLAIYAPTYRDYDFGFASVLEAISASLAQRIGECWKTVFRGHHLLPSAVTRKSSLMNVDHMDVSELLCACDLLVTDYSSIMFDFLNVGKPIVLHVPDHKMYKATRGLYWDIATSAPGPVSTSLQGLETILLHGTYSSPLWRDARASYKSRFCSFDDGKAAQRVIRRCFGLTPLLDASSRKTLKRSRNSTRFPRILRGYAPLQAIRPPHILANRQDGLGERLSALLNAHVLAHILDAPLSVCWNDDVWNPDYTSASASTCTKIQNVSMLTKQQLFSADYVEQHFQASTNDNGANTLPRQKLSFEALKRGSSCWVAGQLYLSQNLADCFLSSLPSLYKHAFKRIGFSDRAQDLMALAKDSGLPNNTWGLHMRSGDMVFGECRKWGLWSNKVVNVGVAEHASKAMQQANRVILLACQDEQIENYLASKFDVMRVSSINQSVGLQGPEKALHDMFVLSQAHTVLGGRSGFSRFPCMINGFNSTEILEMYSTEKYSQITEKYFRDNAGLHHPLQEAYGLWQAYSFWPQGRKPSDSRSLLTKAWRLDPDNYLYPLTVVYLFFSEGDYGAGNQLLGEILESEGVSINEHHPVIMALMHKYPGLGFSRRAHFREYANGADLGYSYCKVVAPLIEEKLHRR